MFKWTQDCSFIFDKNGRHKKLSFVNLCQRNLKDFVGSGDHSYSRIPPRKVECQRRLGIPESCGFKQLETRPASINLDSFPTRDWSVCNTSDLSNSKILFMETRPKFPENSCFSTVLGRTKRVCFPILSLIGRVWEKLEESNTIQLQ